MTATAKPSLPLVEPSPQLATEWHPTRNGSTQFTDFSSQSHHKAWWVCEQGHEWETAIYNRVKAGCPYCSNRKTLTGFNDLNTTHPDLASEWHPTLNEPLTPEQVSAGMSKKVWWLGKCGHEWEAFIGLRSSQHTGCPFCSNNKLLTGFNDLITVNPTLAAQWHPTRNLNLQADSVLYGTAKKVWWLCEKGHEWEAVVHSRANGRKCPACAGQKTLAGYKDLETLRPEVAAEWHGNKNNKTPAEYNVSSNIKVWWLCAAGHEWQARISDRTGHNTKCPKCYQPSKAETELALFFFSVGLEVETNNRTVLPGQEIDIYLPQKKMGVEFNGLYWHSEEAGKGRRYHYNKWLAAKQAGVQLIQIWEDDWKRNPELIKTMLTHKLGTSKQRKIFARKTIIQQVTTAETMAFLNQNHIQGFASGSHYLSLQTPEHEIVALLVLKKEGTGTLNIIRYATAANVIGGFTKLLTYAEKEYKPNNFLTFADHTVSDGGLYENNGFLADREIPPDYMYVINKQRKHKFGYRLKRFRNDPELLWEEGYTERQLAALNNIPRIWDAGKTRYVKTVTKPN